LASLWSVVLPAFFSGGCAFGLGLYLSWPSLIYFSMVGVCISSAESSSSSSLSSSSLSSSSSSSSAASYWAFAALSSSNYFYFYAVVDLISLVFRSSICCLFLILSASLILFYLICSYSFRFDCSSYCYYFLVISSLCFCKSASLLLAAAPLPFLPPDGYTAFSVCSFCFY